MRYFSILFSVLCLTAFTACSQDSSNYTNREIIYGHKDSLALSMVVLEPTKRTNSKAIIQLVLGNYISQYRWVPSFIHSSQPYTDAGYTVFVTMLGSQPRYTIPEQVADMQRAIRYVRYHAKEYGIDPNKIGITGMSAGGHLALLAGTLDNKVDSLSTDPVDKVSSRVQAVACFYPPTDFLNFGTSNINRLPGHSFLVSARVAAAFDFKTWSTSQQAYIPVKDSALILQTVRNISPVYSVSSDDPPMLIVHGNADPVVPLQQSEVMINALKKGNVPNNLVIKPGAGHGWNTQNDDCRQHMVPWFDKWLQ